MFLYLTVLRKQVTNSLLGSIIILSSHSLSYVMSCIVIPFASCAIPSTVSILVIFCVPHFMSSCMSSHMLQSSNKYHCGAPLSIALLTYEKIIIALLKFRTFMIILSPQFS